MSQVLAGHVGSGTAFDINIKQEVGRVHVVNGAQYLIFPSLGCEFVVAEFARECCLHVQRDPRVYVDTEIGPLAFAIWNLRMYLDSPSNLQKSFM